MENYIYINDYSKKGKIALSLSIFKSLVDDALNNIEGISRSKKINKKGQEALLPYPFSVSIHKGIVHILIKIDIYKGNNIQNVTTRIQNEISKVFVDSVEQIPFNVQVKVESII